jgi:hypothetical protein
VSDIQIIVNQTSNWLRFRNYENSAHNLSLGPQSAAHFEWRPGVPWCTSQNEFDSGKKMEFEGPGIGASSWFLYERWGQLRVFRNGYEVGASPPGFPRASGNQLRIYIGPGTNDFKMLQW